MSSLDAGRRGVPAHMHGSARIGGYPRMHDGARFSQEEFEAEEFNRALNKRTVYITGLHPATTVATLRPYVEKFGTVVELHVSRYKGTCLSRCTANVVFLEEKGAQEIRGEFEGAARRRQYHVVDGKRIDVRPRDRQPGEPTYTPRLLNAMLNADRTNGSNVDEVSQQLREHFGKISGDRSVEVRFHGGDLFRLSFSVDHPDATERVLACGKDHMIDELTSVTVSRCIFWRNKPKEGPQRNRYNKMARLAMPTEDMDFYEAMEHLKISHSELPCNGISHEFDLSFDVQFRPHLIISISPHDMPNSSWSNISERPNILNCGRELAGKWLRRMFVIAQDVVEKYEKERAVRQIEDERYKDATYSLVFNVGSWQSSRSWTGHIVFPVHMFFLYRLLHYRSLPALMCRGNQPIALPAAQQRVEEQLDCLQSECEQGVKCVEAKDVLENVDGCKWCQLETWPNYVKKVGEFVKDQRGSYKEGAGKVESGIGFEILAKLARMEDRPGAILGKHVWSDEHPALPEEFPLGKPYAMCLCGLEVCLTMDKENEGTTELTVNFLTLSPLCDADPSQLEQVVEVLHKVGYLLSVSNYCLAFSSHMTTEAIIEMEEKDFARFLSVEDTRLWVSHWRDRNGSILQGEMAKFSGHFVQELNPVPPV